MEHFTPIPASIGGVLIGLSATLLWIADGRIADGRIAGVSGIVGKLWTARAGDVTWRIAFVIGLVAAPALYWMSGGELPHITVSAPWPLVMIAGLLVGFGTRLEHLPDRPTLDDHPQLGLAALPSGIGGPGSDFIAARTEGAAWAPLCDAKV